MGSLLKRISNVSFALLFAVFSINLSGVMTIHTAFASNNGTLQVHEQGTPDGQPSNSPKVCTFNFEVFGVDPSQSGDITIEGQGMTPGGVYLTVPITSDASGDGASAYVNDGGAYSLADGHYKATLDNKFGTDPGDKAKSKVFKVECGGASDPAAPTFTDECGTANDTITIPDASDGTYYRINNALWLIPGTFAASGTKTVTQYDGNGTWWTSADDTLLGEWSYTYTDEPCTVPAEPTFVDECGTEDDRLIIPAWSHSSEYSYWFDLGAIDLPIASGTYDDYLGQPFMQHNSGTVTIKAKYKLKTIESWSHTYTNEDCVAEIPAEPTFIDECGTERDSYTIAPATGIVYRVNGVVTQPGTYSYASADSVEITAEADQGYVYNGQDSWSYKYTDTNCITVSGLCQSSQKGVVLSLTNHSTVAEKAYIEESLTGWFIERDLAVGEMIKQVVPYQNFLAKITVAQSDKTVVYSEDFDCTPGRGGVMPTNPEKPVIIPTNLALPLTGPQTANPLAAIMTIIFAAVMTYGATFYLVNRRDLGQK